MARATLSIDRLRSLLRYSPDTGVFTWVTPTSDRMKSGQVAGGPSPDGYWRISVDYVRYRAHRLAWFYMTGAWPTNLVDHINGNKRDDRWVNLREADHSQNKANRGKPASNTSGFKGVTFDRARDKWAAQIHVRRRHIYLGRFDTPEAAHAAYSDAAKRLFGKFARDA